MHTVCEVMATSDQGYQPEHTLSIAEAASELNVHPSTIHRYIRERSLPAHKVEGEHGPEWRIRTDDVAAYAQGRQRAHTVLSEEDSGRVAELTEKVEQLVQTVSTEFGGRQKRIEARLNELAKIQKALPEPEEARLERAEREQRMEEALRGNTARIEELAEENGRLLAESQQLRADNDQLRKKVVRLTELLEAERRKTWWQRLVGK